MVGRGGGGGYLVQVGRCLREDEPYLVMDEEGGETGITLELGFLSVCATPGLLSWEVGEAGAARPAEARGVAAGWRQGCFAFSAVPHQLTQASGTALVAL